MAEEAPRSEEASRSSADSATTPLRGGGRSTGGAQTLGTSDVAVLEPRLRHQGTHGLASAAALGLPAHWRALFHGMGAARIGRAITLGRREDQAVTQGNVMADKVGLAIGTSFCLVDRNNQSPSRHGSACLQTPPRRVVNWVRVHEMACPQRTTCESGGIRLCCAATALCSDNVSMPGQSGRNRADICWRKEPTEVDKCRARKDNDPRARCPSPMRSNRRTPSQTA